MFKDKLEGFIVLLLIAAVIGISLLVRVQNMSIAELTDSVKNLSSSVLDLVKRESDKALGVGGQTAAQIANPASVNCLTKGGKLVLRDRPQGQYGVCVFEDDRQCEEWALDRGDCPDGGLKITGYTNDANIYCAITGHVSIESDKPGEAGTCQVDGVTCPAQQYFDTGECGKKQ